MRTDLQDTISAIVTQAQRRSETIANLQTELSQVHREFDRDIQKRIRSGLIRGGIEGKNERERDAPLQSSLDNDDNYQDAISREAQHSEKIDELTIEIDSHTRLFRLDLATLHALGGSR